MECKLEVIVHHLQFADCTPDAEEQSKKAYDRPPQQQAGANLGPPIGRHQ